MNAPGPPLPETDRTRRLLHELEVHQIELEMQNEELRKSRAQAEAALARYTELYDFSPLAYFTLDRKGAILQTNLAGARLLGVERAPHSGAAGGLHRPARPARAECLPGPGVRRPAGARP